MDGDISKMSAHNIIHEEALKYARDAVVDSGKQVKKDRNSYYLTRSTDDYCFLHCVNKAKAKCKVTMRIFFTDQSRNKLKYSKGGKIYKDKMVFSIQHEHRCLDEIHPSESQDLMMKILHCLSRGERKICKPVVNTHATIQSYIFHRTKWMKINGNDNNNASRLGNNFRNSESVRVPRMFFDRSKDRFEIDRANSELDAIKSTYSTSMRLELMASVVNCSKTSRKKIGAPIWSCLCRNSDSPFVKNSIELLKLTEQTHEHVDVNDLLVPLFDFSRCSKTFNPVEVVPTPDIVKKGLLFNGTYFECSKFDLGICVETHGKSNSKYMLYKDRSNTIGNGKEMGYLRVGDYLTRDEIQNCRNLSTSLKSDKLLPLFLMIVCQFKWSIGETEFKDEKNKYKLENWNPKYKSQIDDFITTVVIPFVTDLRCCFLHCLNDHNVTLDLFKRLVWEEWPPFADRYDACRSKDYQEEINDKKKKYDENEIRISRNFHYATIMALSSQSADSSTKEYYNLLLHEVYTPREFLNPLSEMEFLEFFEVNYEILRRSSMAATKLLSVIQYAVVSLVLFDGDIAKMSDVEMRSISQISQKKQAITKNIVDPSSFSQVGGDIHVTNFLKASAAIKDPSLTLTEEAILYILSNIEPGVGYVMNELLGQCAQLFNSKETQIQEKNLIRKIIESMKEKEVSYSSIFEKWQAYRR